MKQYQDTADQPEASISPEVLTRASPDLDPRNQKLMAAGGGDGARVGSP
jgi:hypothetical protein